MFNLTYYLFEWRFDFNNKNCVDNKQRKHRSNIRCIECIQFVVRPNVNKLGYRSASCVHCFSGICWNPVGFATKHVFSVKISNKFENPTLNLLIISRNVVEIGKSSIQMRWNLVETIHSQHFGITMIKSIAALWI